VVATSNLCQGGRFANLTTQPRQLSGLSFRGNDRSQEAM